MTESMTNDELAEVQELNSGGLVHLSEDIQFTLPEIGCPECGADLDDYTAVQSKKCAGGRGRMVVTQGVCPSCRGEFTLQSTITLKQCGKDVDFHLAINGEPVCLSRNEDDDHLGDDTELAPPRLH